jgi:hypothetical protein
MNWLALTAVTAAFVFFSIFVFLKGKEERFNKALKQLSVHFSIPFLKEQSRSFFLTFASVDGFFEGRRVKVKALTEGGLHTVLSVSMRAVLSNPIKMSKESSVLRIETKDKEKAEKVFTPEIKQRLLSLKPKRLSMQVTPGRVLVKVPGIETSFKEMTKTIELCISVAEGFEKSLASISSH